MADDILIEAIDRVQAGESVESIKIDFAGEQFEFVINENSEFLEGLWNENYK